MATITTRAGKGTPLTNDEVDANFVNLNTDKLQAGDTASSLTITSADINGGTIDASVIGGTTPAAISGTTLSATGNITVVGTVDGRDVATDGTKLDAIEASATADQTGAQIKTAYEAETNAFTDAQFTKLGGIEASATADQTAAEIRALVESATDSNVFTDADHTKLNAVEALADVTDTANVTSSGALMDSELTAIASVKALNQGVATGDSPTFSNLTLSGTASVKVPSGTTAQRDGTPANGMFRYNSTNEQFEGYQSSAWGAIGGGGGSNTFTTDTFTGNGTVTAYALSQVINSENNLMVFIGGVFQQQSAYSIATASGVTTLTFSEAPANTREIVIYSIASAVSGSNLNNDQFTANGSTTAFTLSIAPVHEANTMVFIDGVYQQKTDYAVSGTTLTFDAAPANSSVVEVSTFTQTDINVPVDNSVTTAILVDGSVTSAKIASDVALAGNPTAATQATGNTTTRLATTAFVQQEVTALVDSSPSTLDTLNELAAALGDDPNFATTTATSIGTKLPLSGGTLTGTLQGTRVGIGVAAHSSAALNITTTDQHIRFNNGSELGIIDLDSDGELNIWAHGDGEVINLRTGSGAGSDIVKISPTGIDVAGTTEITSTAAIPLKVAYNSTNYMAIGHEFTNVVSGGVGHIFKINNTQKMLLSASGLDVTGAVNSTGEMRITNPSATSQLYLYGAAGQKANIILNEYGVRAWHLGAGTFTSGNFSISDGSTERLVINSSGFVGIGADPLNAKVDIARESDYTSHTGHGLAIHSSGNTAYTSLYVGTDDTIDCAYIQTAGRNASFTSKSLLLNPNGGNVGIGCTPARKLEVNTGAEGYIARFKGATSAVDIFAGNTGTFTGGLITTPTNIPLGFSTNTGTGDLIIDTSGRVLVGITGASGYGMLESTDLAVTGQCILARASGSVLVGTTSIPTGGASTGFSISDNGGKQMVTHGVSGTSNTYVNIYKNANGTVGGIRVSGSATSYDTSSDYRLKENVVPMTGSIDRVKALKPSRFNFIADSDTTVDGFLAHEAQEVVPEAVGGTKDAMRDEEYEVTPAVYEDMTTPAVEAVDAVLDADGLVITEAVEAQEATTESVLTTEAVMGTRSVPDMQGIDQSKLVPLLVAALQEAITQIESLTARIAALEE